MILGTPTTSLDRGPRLGRRRSGDASAQDDKLVETGLLQDDHQGAAVGLDLASGRGLGVFNLMGAVHVAGGLDHSNLLESRGDEVALAVDVGIDFVRYGVLFALVSLDADIVRAGACPEGLAVWAFEGRLSDAEVVTLANDLDRLGAGVAVILAAAEEEERAYRDRYVRLFLQRSKNSTDNGVLIGLVGQDPTGLFEGVRDLLLVANQHKVHQIAFVAP